MSTGRLAEDLRLGVRRIRAQKLRSLLTMLGVIFGVAAVVAMLAIAGGAERAAIQQIQLLGTHNLRIHHLELGGEAREEADHKGSEGLSFEDARMLQANLPDVEGVAPVRVVDVQVLLGRKEATGQVIATNAAYGPITDFHPMQGRFLSDLDLREAKRVAVIGSDVKAELFGFRQPVGRQIRIGDSWFTVVGLMEPKMVRDGRASPISIRNINKDIYIPLTTALDRFPTPGSRRIEEIAIRVKSEEQIVPVAHIARRMLRRTHRGVEDFDVLIPAELLARARNTQRVFNIVMGSIAAISLLVGGIGIMNVMLTTVGERTHEIGIRRAVGATRRAILGQFLLETVLICVAGGAVGIVFGFALAEVITRFAGWDTVMSPWGTIVAFVISVLVGIVFGLYPARRAARMDPIVALRSE